MPIEYRGHTTIRPAAARYRWRILIDHNAEPGASAPSNANARGMEGPSNADPLLQTNPAKFSLWTDDNELVYSGWIFGDFDGFEPLDDFGAPNFGCSYVKLNGAIL